MTRTSVLRAAVLAGVLALTVGVARADVPVVSFLAKLLLAGAVLALLLWLLARAYQAFLWKVSRRLAFSYFLIGVVPIPLLALLALCTTYVLATFFLGHLYRDTLAALQLQQVERAEGMLGAFATNGRPAAPRHGAFAFDYYRRGERVGGAGAAPAAWPAWLTEAPPEEMAVGAPELARFVLLEDGALTLAVAVEAGELGVTAVYTGDPAEALRRRSGAWVELVRSETAEAEPEIVTFLGREARFRSPTLERQGATGSEEQQKFFQQGEGGGSRLDRPLVYWQQLAGPVQRLADGQLVSRTLQILVTATPRLIAAQLVSGSSEHDAAVWIALLAITSVLSGIYAVAVLVALAMIFGLSRAVNRLSRATTAVQEGKFSVRIPVRRGDQVGALQRSFNDMAANLEGLVATAAQKEILEKELSIARELQESLLPGNLPQGEAVEFATLFEPSAAIGGDYFDILRLDERRLAVVIADVSGHGLSSGLRMAMLKAALLILVDEEEEPAAILRRLDALVRTNAEKRFFVTATLALFDVTTGVLDLNNAGHPPTYLLRRGEVEEILLPGAPLGSLGHRYGARKVQLEADDLVVWLSDGLIEAADPGGNAFGYDAVVEALRGPAKAALEVRSRLLSAVERHTGGHPASDDRTLVVMHYRTPVALTEATSPPAPSPAAPSEPSPSQE